MYFIQFEGRLRRRGGGSAVGGAFINCWIERESSDAALRAARGRISVEGWLVDEPEETAVVDESWYADPGKPGREYYEQALIDKEVFVIHTFPDADATRSGPVARRRPKRKRTA